MESPEPCGEVLLDCFLDSVTTTRGSLSVRSRRRKGPTRGCGGHQRFTSDEFVSTGEIVQLEGQGIKVRAGSMPGLAEEAPKAYKDVDAVVDAVAGAGIARKVARLRPVAVVKG